MPIQFVEYEKNQQHNAHLFWLILENENVTNSFIQHLKSYNLNALKHYYPLHLSSYAISSKMLVNTENTTKNIIIKVKDNGIGMNKNVQKNVFRKFYREETGNIHNVKGHGLGLAYVKKIVEHHQGIVFVESVKGKGSTFSIKLPLI